ncbi:MAG: transcription elongation factor [Candidatus Thorarchaeota archaeon]
MGRRRRQKVRRRPQKRIPDVYPCPDCGNTAIKIELQRSNALASVKCGSCGLEMSVDDVNPLTEAVDIYGTFIDRFYEERSAEAA